MTVIKDKWIYDEELSKATLSMEPMMNGQLDKRRSVEYNSVKSRAKLVYGIAKCNLPEEQIIQMIEEVIDEDVFSKTHDQNGKRLFTTTRSTQTDTVFSVDKMVQTNKQFICDKSSQTSRLLLKGSKPITSWVEAENGTEGLVDQSAQTSITIRF